jgi:hypothetical protein
VRQRHHGAGGDSAAPARARIRAGVHGERAARQCSGSGRQPCVNESATVELFRCAVVRVSGTTVIGDVPICDPKLADGPRSGPSLPLSSSQCVGVEPCDAFGLKGSQLGV